MRKYSIIVVTRNNADGLSRTLQSIRSLCYKERETIVIDGASTDNTHDVLADAADIVTTAISEKDTGIYNAMNKGIKHVTGDYVVFMNAGDMFAHAGVLDVVNASSGDIILGGETYGGQVRTVPPQMTLYDILAIGINHQAVYYRRELLQKYGFDESYRVAADLKSVVEPLAREQATVSCIPDILATCEGGGLSKQRWRDIRLEKQRIISEVVSPFYVADYQRFAFISHELIDDFVALSAFRSLYPFVRLLGRLMRWFNARFKHIPLVNTTEKVL